jgi:predicted ATPase
MILKSIGLRNIPEDRAKSYPWCLNIIKNFTQLQFNKNISLLVGENGSGKSTILESIAAAIRVPIAGSNRLEDDESLSGAIDLGDYLTLKYEDRVAHGLFVRAEDFIGFARKIKKEIKSLENEAEEVKKNWKGGDIKLALGAIEGEKNQLISRYSEDLEAMSHGEGFLKFFNARITGRGIYLIDEPEAALSPARQLVLIALIRQKVKEHDAQFIIATHSPLIMTIPDSEVLYFSEDEISKRDYKETDHYKITMGILSDPNKFLM